MKKRILSKVLAVVLAASMVAGISGCSKKESSETKAESTETSAVKDSLIVGLSVDPQNLDPNDNNSQNIHRVKTQIYETLVFRDANGKITPGLAESWEMPDDKTIIFHLRKGVKFHNGEELKASDVLYTMKRCASMGAASAAVAYVDLDKCEAVDDYTFKLVNTEPYVPQLSFLEWPLTAIVNEKAVEESEGDFFKAPVGTGPYKLENWVSGDKVELTANEEYWGGAPAIKHLTFKIVTESTNRALMLETGELDVAYDIATVDAERIASGNETTLVKSAAYNLNYIGFGCDYEPFNNPLVRQAIAWAVDVESDIKSVYNGAHELATGFMDPLVDGYVPVELPGYDVEKAKALLAEAGYPDGLTITIYTQDDTERIALSELIQNQLRAININAEVEILAMGAISDLIDNSKIDGLFVFGATCTTVEADKALRNFLSTSPGSMNTSQYKNPEYDELLNKACTTYDDDVRYDLYKQCQEILARDLPWVPTYNKQQLVGIRSDVKGYENGSFECARFKTVYFD